MVMTIKHNENSKMRDEIENIYMPPAPSVVKPQYDYLIFNRLYSAGNIV